MALLLIYATEEAPSVVKHRSLRLMVDALFQKGPGALFLGSHRAGARASPF
jgi:hypothetical protein